MNDVSKLKLNMNSAVKLWIRIQIGSNKNSETKPQGQIWITIWKQSFKVEFWLEFGNEASITISNY